MPDNPQPAKRAFVTLNDVEWELIPTDKLDFAESREVKRICGMGLVPFERALADADPDAWLAWVYVSVRRQWANVTVEEIEASLGSVVGLIETVRDESPEAATIPPERPEPNSEGEQPNGNGSGEKTPQPSTLATSGSPTSEIPT